jgi:TatD DNase family protein
MILFDAHSHLPDAAPRQGIQQVICGTRESDWAAILAHAKSAEWVIPMLGLHPWFVPEASPEWALRQESLLHSHRAGVGECGLDFSWKEVDRMAQEAAFRVQLRLAHSLHRPVAMHVVGAWGRLVDLLREEGVPPAGAMVHAYTGSPETAQALQALGVFLSFSGDFLRAERPKVRESLRAVAASHLLLETDGTADLVRILEVAAELRRASVEELAAQTWENGLYCFKEIMA